MRGFQAAQYLDGLRLPLDPGTSSRSRRSSLRPRAPRGAQGPLVRPLRPDRTGRPDQHDLQAADGDAVRRDRRPESARSTASRARSTSAARTRDGIQVYRLTGLARDAAGRYDITTGQQAVHRAELHLAADIGTPPSRCWRNTPKSTTRASSSTCPASARCTSTRYGRIPYHRYLGEPSVDGYRLEQASVGYAFEHRINDGLQFRQNLRLSRRQNDLDRHPRRRPANRSPTAPRSINYVRSGTNNLAIDNQLQADIVTGPAGAQDPGRASTTSTSRATRTIASPASRRSTCSVPGYGAPVPTRDSLKPFILPTPSRNRPASTCRTRSRSTVDAGFDRPARLGHHRKRQPRLRSRRQARSPPKTPIHRPRRPELSVRLRPRPLRQLFDLVRPVQGTTFGRPVQAAGGEGQEIGIKYQAPGTNLMVTAAAFDIKQQNVLTADPNPDPAFSSVQTGEVQVKGFEFEIRGNLTRNLEIVGGYSHLDPRITKSNNRNSDVGKYMVNVAVNNASLWGMYTSSTAGLAGLGVGGGVRYVGESYARNAQHRPHPGLHAGRCGADLRFRLPAAGDEGREGAAQRHQHLQPLLCRVLRHRVGPASAGDRLSTRAKLDTEKNGGLVSRMRCGVLRGAPLIRTVPNGVGTVRFAAQHFVPSCCTAPGTAMS